MDTFLGSDERFNNLCVTTSTKQGSTYFINPQWFWGQKGRQGVSEEAEHDACRMVVGWAWGDSSSRRLTNITFLCLKDGMNWVCKNVTTKKK